MEEKQRRRAQLECLYDMFRDRIEENVIYIVYTENDGEIDLVIDQLMSIAKCSLTGYDFEPPSRSPVEPTASPVNGHSGERTSSSATTNNNNNTTSRSATSSPAALKDPDGFIKYTKYTRPKKVQPINKGAKKSSTEEKYVDEDKLDEGGDEEDQDDNKELTLDEQIEREQKAIENLLNEKNTCHDKASHYLSKKMFPVTSYYSELSGNYRRMIETKTRKLIDLLLLKSENANTIDLHGLNPVQAKLVVTELLSIRQDQLSIDKQGEANIDIITGWGKHTTQTGSHRIRATILALLREKHYDFSHINKGAVRVTIRR